MKNEHSSIRYIDDVKRKMRAHTWTYLFFYLFFSKFARTCASNSKYLVRCAPSHTHNFCVVLPSIPNIPIYAYSSSIDLLQLDLNNRRKSKWKAECKRKRWRERKHFDRGCFQHIFFPRLTFSATSNCPFLYRFLKLLLLFLVIFEGCTKKRCRIFFHNLHNLGCVRTTHIHGIHNGGRGNRNTGAHEIHHSAIWHK